MKKTKIEQRIENAFNAFFETECSNNNSSIVIAENNALTPPLASEQFKQNTDKYFDYFKKIFSFVPGVLFLHLAAPAALEFGFGLWLLFWLAAGIFMVWAGIGDLKNKKHFLLPLSVMATAIVFALPFGVLPAHLINYYVYFYIGVLPLLFIAPILTKGLIEKNERNES